jgi:hypothetical protein
MSAQHAAAPSALQSPLLREAVNQWLVRHCAVRQDITQGAVLLRGTQGMRLIACQPGGQPTPASIASVAASAVERRERLVLPHVGIGGRAGQVVAHPLVLAGMVVGASVVVLDTSHPPGDAECAALDASAVAFHMDPPAADRGAAAANAQRTLDMLNRATACSNLAEAAETLCTALANALACDRVSISLRRRGQTMLVGSSDHWQVEVSALEADVCAAMDEAIDSTRSVLYPAPAGHENWLVAAHAHLGESLEGRALCTVPLVAGGQIVGALLAERRQADVFLVEERDWLEQLAQAVAPWLVQSQRLALPYRERARDALAAWRSGEGAGRRRLAGASLVLVLGAILGWPVDRVVSAPVKLEGAHQRIISAPADSYLQSVMVRPGDVVKAGQLLLEFASADLQVERQRLAAELAGNDAAAGDALARQDRSAMALRVAKVDENKAQLALLDQRLARAKIVAPFDAVVIQGDLTDALGAPARKGDALMTLAPVGDFRAIVEVDDADIAAIRVGQEGAMVLGAMPGGTLNVRVKRITPLAAVAQGRSFFDVEVDVATTGTRMQDLRPGMRGIARLNAERGPRGAAWLQSATDGLRLAWWRWIG